MAGAPTVVLAASSHPLAESATASTQFAPTVPGSAAPTGSPGSRADALRADGWSIEIHSLGYVADAGIPFPLNVTVSGSFLPPQRIAWSDTLGDFGLGANFSVVSATPVNVTVEVAVTPYGGDPIRANRSIAVVADPTISVTAGRPSVDVGIPFPVALAISGGTGPFALSWSLDPDPVGNRSLLASDGGYRLSLNASRPGIAVVDAELLDVWGFHQRIAEPVARSYPRPNGTLTLSSTVTEVGAPARLSATIADGAPPLNWSVVTSIPAWNGSPAEGVLDGSGVVTWSGTFENPGEVNLLVRVSDEVGGAARMSSNITVEPQLTVAFRAAWSSSGSTGLAAEAEIVGGVPGYRISWTVNGTSVGTQTFEAPGIAVFPLPAEGGGNRTVSVVVVDGLGMRATATTVYLPSPSTVFGPPGRPSPTPSANGAGTDVLPWSVGGAGVVFGLVAFWRSRRKPAPRAEPSPELERQAMAATRRLLRGSDGLERGTLVFLAEEQGLSAPAVGDAIERWIRSGRIQVEEGLEGEAVLRWTDPARASLGDAEPDGEGETP